MNSTTCWILLAAACFLQAASLEAQVPDSPTPALRLKVVSFNIRYLTSRDKGANHWTKRKTRTAAAMAHFDADVIGVQEAFVSQLNDIKPSLPAYERVGVGRDDGVEAGETCSILFRADLIEQLAHGTFWLSDTPEKAGSKSWGNKVVRICTWALLRQKATGRKLYVFNTHFDHAVQPAREQSARLIAQRIATRAEQDAPFVLMGDFNAAEDNVLVRYLKGEKVELTGGSGMETVPVTMVDSFRVANPEATEVCTVHGFTGRTQGPKIDHVFVAPEVKVDAATIDHFQSDDLYPSDHFPVTATLVFPAS